MKYIVLMCSMVFLMPLNSIAAKKKKKKEPVKKVTPIVAPVKATPNTATTLMLCNTDYGMPTWYLNFVKGFKFPENFQSPAHYRLLTINEKQLDEYLKTIPFEKSDMKIKVPVYNNGTIDCVELTIERVYTMDSALQVKYPNLMSFRIYDKNKNLNAGRVDCDGTSTKIMLNYEGETYFVTPILFNNKNYYVCYSKNDPNLIKKPFERR